MSVTTEITIWCDGDPCGDWYSESHRNATQLRGILARQGWTYSRKTGADLCPDCSKEIES